MKKVLIACGDPTVREILGEMLTEFGYEPIEFDNGRGVWTALEKGQMFDLLLLDQYLPSMSGEQLLLYIKEHDKLKSLPVIIMSGLLHSSDVERLTGFGAHTVLSKPIRLATLKAVTAAALDSDVAESA